MTRTRVSGLNCGVKVTSGWGKGVGKGQSSSFYAGIASEMNEEDNGNGCRDRGREIRGRGVTMKEEDDMVVV